MKTLICCGQINSKIDEKYLLHINPKPDLYNINAHTKFGENPLIFTQVIVRKRKYGRTDRHRDSQRDTIIPCHFLQSKTRSLYQCTHKVWRFVCVEVLRPSQPNGVMSSAVSLPNHTFTGQV